MNKRVLGLKKSLERILEDVKEEINPYNLTLGSLALGIVTVSGLAAYLYFKRPEEGAPIYTPTHMVSVSPTPTTFFEPTPTYTIIIPAETPTQTPTPETPTPTPYVAKTPTHTPIPTSIPIPTPQTLELILPKNPYDAYWVACNVPRFPDVPDIDDYTIVIHDELTNVHKLMEQGYTIKSQVIGPDGIVHDMALGELLRMGPFPQYAGQEVTIRSLAEDQEGRRTNMIEHTYLMPRCPPERPEEPPKIVDYPIVPAN